MGDKLLALKLIELAFS